MTDRSERSHIRSDGTAKVAYPTRDAAIAVLDQYYEQETRRLGRTRVPTFVVYKCRLRPVHYHVGRTLT